MIRAILILAAFGVSSCQSSGNLRPFTTDGCSAFPDGLPGHRDLWLRCCTAHDQTYWLGGTYENRLAADQELRQCVASVGKPAIAEIMLRGVRVGGSPWWPTSFRWGYGWPYGRGYAAVTAEEKLQAARLLQQFQAAHPEIPVH